MPEDARKYDFLETGRTDLEYAPQAPPLSEEQLALLDTGRAWWERRKKDEIDAEYSVVRAASDQAALKYNTEISQAPWNKAKIDWGLLPAAAKITGTLIATAATGGLAAPAVGTLWSDVKKGLKSIDSVGEVADTAFKVKDYVGDQFVAANAAADRILGDLNVKDSAGIIANTQALAITGDVDAQRGAVILAKVAGARKRAGVGPGQAIFPIQTPEQAAVVAQIVGETTYPMTGSDYLKVSDVRQSWWRRFLAYFGIGDGK